MMEIKMLEKKVPSTDGQHTLSGRVYLPGQSPRGIFHVVHGMTEHIARYDKFMRQLAAAGFICCGYDHLGHGHTVNSADELGFIAEKDGWRYLAQDVTAFQQAIRAEYGEQLPYVLMGHSMGSFIVRTAVDQGLTPNRLIIMGTGGPNPLAGAGLAFIRLQKKLHGERYVSKAAYKMVFGAYTHRFDKNDEYSWLTKDLAVREKYAADPLCNFKFTLSAMEDLITLNRYCNRPQWFETVARKMPILMVSGAEDPVGDYGRGVRTVYEKLKEQGADVTLHLYQNCRHEILNDSCYDQTVSDIQAFISKL